VVAEADAVVEAVAIRILAHLSEHTSNGHGKERYDDAYQIDPEKDGYRLNFSTVG
jgi:hypothetical protein